MSERRPVERAPSPDTLVVDLDELDELDEPLEPAELSAVEEFDLDRSIVVDTPVLAQGSETHDRSSVARELDALSKQELDAALLAYLIDRDE